MKDNNRIDGRTNSPFRHKVEMETGSFSYDDHITSYLEREDKRGNSKQAREKVMSSYSDTLYGKAYGKHNPEYLDDLDLQHYDNPFERQYQINKRKSERVSVITKKPAKVQANLNVNEASQSPFSKENGWRKVSGWTDEFKEGMTKNWNDRRVNGMLNSIGGYLGAKFATYTWKQLLAAGAVGTTLSVGLYSGYKKLEDDDV